MSTSQHILSRCNWITSFDQKDEAPNLQNKLSEWTKVQMTQEFQRIADKYCPSDEHWRISEMNLDLGSVSYADAENQLKERFVDALESYFENLQSSQELDSKLVQKSSLSGTTIEAIKAFLLNGTLPWYIDKSTFNFETLVRTQMNESEKELSEVIKSLGQAEYVRRRIVWQLDERMLESIVGLLEPSHSEFIVDYVVDVKEAQQKQKVVSDNSKNFEKEVWYWVLTHLIVERGSYFNTKAFVLSTLQQMASHYNLKFDDLFDQISIGVSKLEKSASPTFIQVVVDLSKERSDSQELIAESSSISTHESWSILKGVILKKNDGDGDFYDAFELIRKVEEGRLKAFIVDRVSDEYTVNHLVNLLSENELEQIVSVVDKNNVAFILSHVDQLKSTISDSTKSSEDRSKSVWEVVLVALLVERGSYFNKKDFVKNTFLKLSQRQNVDYLTLLTSFKSVKGTNSSSLIHLQEFSQLINDLIKEHTGGIKLHYKSMDIRVLQGYLHHGRRDRVIDGIFAPEFEAVFHRMFISDKQKLLAFYLESGVQGSIVERTVKYVPRNEVLDLLGYLFKNQNEGFEELSKLLNSVPAEEEGILIQVWKYLHSNQASSQVDLSRFLRRQFGYLINDEADVLRGVIQEQKESVDEFIGGQLSTNKTVLLKELQGVASNEKFISRFVQTVDNVHKMTLKSTFLVSPISFDRVMKFLTSVIENKEAEAIIWQVLLSSNEKKITEERLIQKVLKRLALEGRLLSFINAESEGLYRDVSKWNLEQTYKNHSLTDILKEVESSSHVQRSDLKILTELNQVFDSAGLSIQQVKSIHYVLKKQLLEIVSKKSNLKGKILSEVIRFLMANHDLDVPNLLGILKRTKTISVELKNQVSNMEKELQEKNENQDELEQPSIPYFKKGESFGQPMEVQNAGIVIIQAYLSMYFDRLGLLKDGDFESADAAQRAIHYLQFLATGQTSTSEEFLVLNKAICGIDLQDPIIGGIEMTQDEISMGEGLIQAVVSHWSAIGSSSVEGVRGNWFVRSGTLTEHEEKWELVVEKKAYDLLLDQAPFSYSILNFKWMEKPLYVNWM